MRLLPALNSFRKPGTAHLASLLACLLLATEACTPRRSSPATEAEPAATSVVGIVTRTTGKDTVPVVGAFVEIKDLRLTTQTDAKGAFQFRAGLVPGRYRVSARTDEENGTTDIPVPVNVGEATLVAIHLGGDATPWPPPTSLDNMAVKAAANTNGRVRH